MLYLSSSSLTGTSLMGNYVKFKQPVVFFSKEKRVSDKNAVYSFSLWKLMGVAGREKKVLDLFSKVFSVVQLFHLHNVYPHNCVSAMLLPLYLFSHNLKLNWNFFEIYSCIYTVYSLDCTLVAGCVAKCCHYDGMKLWSVLMHEILHQFSESFFSCSRVCSHFSTHFPLLFLYSGSIFPFSFIILYALLHKQQQHNCYYWCVGRWEE